MQLTHSKRSRIRSQVPLDTRWRVELRENVSPKYDTNGTVALRQRYLYRGYLQIASYDIRQAAPTAPSYIIWDPTHSIATRPLVIRKDQTWYTYGWDLTKNICEVYGPNGNIRTIYTYTPYGSVTAEGDVEQPIQWSSEYNDEETNLVYYNYRYYNPTNGRWTRRDAIFSSFYFNAYAYAHNTPSHEFDKLGNDVYIRFNKADVCFGGGAAELGIYHMWIKTDKYEAGLGNQNGVPGENGQSSPDCPCSKTFVRDHTNRDYINQHKVENAIENCVNAYISSNLNQYQGRWIPLYNDCNAYVKNIISNCTPQKILKRIDVSGARICPFGMIGGHITGMYITVYGVIYPNNRFVEIK